MSLNRFATRRDTSEPGIVAALEAAGFIVTKTNKPGDLAVRRQWYPTGLNMIFEAKTARGKNGRITKDKRQTAQHKSIERGVTVVVSTPEAALEIMRDFEVYQGGPYGRA